MSQRTNNWILAGLIAFMLGAAHLLDPEDLALTPELTQAQKQAADEARRERAAAQFCVRTHGLNAAHSWDADGHLVCTDKRGRLPVKVATGDQG